MKFFLLCCLVFSSLAFATSDFEVEVYATEEGIDLSELTDPRYKKKELLPEPALPTDLPAPKARDQILTSAGLQKEIKTFDSLDRDILYRKAARLPLEELSKSYPNIDKEKLGKLQGIIHAK